jgi:hypothetical protein
MNAYTVRATDEADDQLMALWLAASDRAAITAAQHQIDQGLAIDPRANGRELGEGLWRIAVPPLKAFYEIDDNQRLVRITGIDRTS